MKSRIIKRELSKEKIFSEEDIVLYLETFFAKSFSGDSFSECPWGEESNKWLYVAIFGIEEGQLNENSKR